MSLAQLIAQRMLAKKSAAAPVQREQIKPNGVRLEVEPVVGHGGRDRAHVGESPRDVPLPTHPRGLTTQPRVPRAEVRRRQSVGQLRRLEPNPAQPVSTRVEPAQPVPTSAPAAPPGPRTITERPPPLPPVAPRAELELDLVKGLQALPLPVAIAPTAAAPTRGRGSCFAIDAGTGRQCRLPAHPEDPDRHRNERGPFFRVLQPGEVPKLREQLDEAGARRSAHDGWDRNDRASGGGVLRAVPKQRVTTEAHRPEDSKYFTPPETGGGNLNFSGLLVDANGTAFHRAGMILPNGELLDDVEASPTPTTEVP